MKAVNYLKALGGVACMVLACGAFAQASATSAAPAAPATASAPAAKAVKKANRTLGYTVRKALAKAQGGAVTLTGTVPDQGQIDLAGDAAKGVKGVTSVSNKLSVMQQ
jgi:hyperosmotically inducible periplasmic protein